MLVFGLIITDSLLNRQCNKMTIPPLSLGITKGAEWLKALHAEMFTYGQSHGLMNKKAEHTSVHALAGRLQAGPNGNLELTVPSSLIKGVFDALDEPGAEFVVRNNRTESAIKVMTTEEVDKLGGISHITERGHSYHYTLGPIVELPATGDYEKLWAISIKSDDLESIRKSYGLETSPQLGFYIPVGCKKKRVTEDNEVSKLAGDAGTKNELVRVKIDDDDGKSLTHHYLNDKKWDYPAGRVEPDEEHADAAVRELRERTGHYIDKSKLKYNGHSGGYHQYSGRLADVSKTEPSHYETGEPRQLSWKKKAGVYTASGDKVQGVGLRKMYHSLLEEQGLPGLGVNNEDTGDVELSFDGDEAKRQEVFNQLGSRVQAKTGHPVTFAPVDIPQTSVPVKLTNKDTERLNAIHHLAYRMSNMYNPADSSLDSNDDFKQKLADRFRLQVNQRGLRGTVPSRAAEQLLGTRPMYEGMMPARRTRSEEEALSDMAEEQKLRLMKALSGGRGFLAPNEEGVSKLASLLKSADRFYDGPPGKKYYDPSNLKPPIASTSANQEQASAQLSGNVPIPGITQDPRGGKYEAMARIKHFQEAANTNVANLKPGTVAAERSKQQKDSEGNAISMVASAIPFAGPAVNALTGLSAQIGTRVIPAATRWAAAGAPLNTPAGIAKGLWNAGSLKAVRNIHPYVNRSMTAANLGGIAGASYGPVGNAVNSLVSGGTKAMEEGRQMAEAPGELISKYLSNNIDKNTLEQAKSALPNIREPAFTVRFGDGHVPTAINNYIADAGRRSAEYASKYYGHYLGNPEGPLETALRYHTPARALSTQLFKALNDQTGVFNAQPPDYKSLGAAHGLSFVSKALKNTVSPGGPGPSINVSPNPLFAKEVISKIPGMPARFISPMLGLKRKNTLTSWADAQGARLANSMIKQPFGARPTPVFPEVDSYIRSKTVPFNSLKPPDLSKLDRKRTGEL